MTLPTTFPAPINHATTALTVDVISKPFNLDNLTQQIHRNMENLDWLFPLVLMSMPTMPNPPQPHTQPIFCPKPTTPTPTTLNEAPRQEFNLAALTCQICHNMENLDWLFPELMPPWTMMMTLQPLFPSLHQPVPPSTPPSTLLHHLA